MKLKKLMALALSGVLAVSMFAGCAKGNVKPEPTPDPEEPTATGYSVTLGDKVDVEKDYITYQDNADDAAALQDALGNMASVSVAANATLPQTVMEFDKSKVFGDSELVIDDFVNALNIENPNLDLFVMHNDLVDWADWNDDDTVKYGVLYVIDGTVDVNKALAQVADKVKNTISNLPNVNYDTVARYTYDYTVSASVVNKALEPFAGYTLSANFIAVTITRVPTAA